MPISTRCAVATARSGRRLVCSTASCSRARNSDSARLFQTLQDHITKPENVVRWRWKEGDVAIWDNQATQHRATADFGLQRRTLRRATIHGEVPVAIDGRQSRTVRQEKAVQYEPA